jgi:alpha-L-fucosidase 2
MTNRQISSAVAILILVLFGYTAMSADAKDNALGAQSDSSDDTKWSELKLWYEQPAQKWTEALPVGNGRLGAMVFGGTDTEQVQLNEDTLWAGKPLDRDRVGAYKYLPEVRQLIFEGKYTQAQRIVQREFMSPRLIRSYQTLGDLQLRFQTAQPVTDYRRELNLDTAIATVTYRCNDASFTREVFTSPVDQCIVVRISGDKPGMTTFDASLSRPADSEVEVIAPGRIEMTGQASHKGRHKGVKFEAQLQILAEGGELTVADNSLQLRNADAATIVIVAATDYKGDDPHTTCSQQMTDAVGKGYSELRGAHVAEHRRLFRRVELDLGRNESVNLPTDKRLDAVKTGAKDPALIALYFQFGRYLLISCSRPGCMPANLQGLWNEHIDAPWNCDYHININVQMNYWPAEVCNLAECHEPFFDLVENLRPRGRKTAKDVYGCQGFVAHHTTDAWWWTSPIGEVRWGMWPMGAAWCCQHLWEHYAFGGDREFLQRRAYPVMKESAEFLLDYLVEDPKTGELVSGPSMSPENRFRTPDGQVVSVTMGPAMDQQIIFDLFTNCIEAANILGINDEFVAKVVSARERLAGPKIGSDGRLMEWNEEFEEPEPGHRHISHLFALHPGKQITLNSTPELAAAARRSLEYRLAHGGGHTGWSRAWIINFWTRLQDSVKAHENVLALLEKSTLPNLFDKHPPFQIDGNFGGTAGIAEMLLQSHTEQIQLLPALPNAWSTGRVKGLRARNNFEVDLTWADGKLLRTNVHAKSGGTCRIQYGDRQVSFETKPGKTYSLDGDLNRI